MHVFDAKRDPNAGFGARKEKQPDDSGENEAGGKARGKKREINSDKRLRIECLRKKNGCKEGASGAERGEFNVRGRESRESG